MERFRRRAQALNDECLPRIKLLSFGPVSNRKVALPGKDVLLAEHPEADYTVQHLRTNRAVARLLYPEGKEPSVVEAKRKRIDSP